MELVNENGKAETFENCFSSPECVIEASMWDDELMLLLKSQNSDVSCWVPAKVANICCPQIVIKYYEERVVWFSCPTGFELGLQPEHIVGADLYSGELLFAMKWKDTKEIYWVSATQANILCPQVVIQFYESMVLNPRIRGFGRGLKPDHIIGADALSGQLLFCMSWIGIDEVDWVAAEEANTRCPQIVIKFYEEHLIWNVPIEQVPEETRYSNDQYYSNWAFEEVPPQPVCDNSWNYHNGENLLQVANNNDQRYQPEGNLFHGKSDNIWSYDTEGNLFQITNNNDWKYQHAGNSFQIKCDNGWKQAEGNVLQAANDTDHRYQPEENQLQAASDNNWRYQPEENQLQVASDNNWRYQPEENQLQVASDNWRYQPEENQLQVASDNNWRYQPEENQLQVASGSNWRYQPEENQLQVASDNNWRYQPEENPLHAACDNTWRYQAEDHQYLVQCGNDWKYQTCDSRMYCNLCPV